MAFLIQNHVACAVACSAAVMKNAANSAKNGMKPMTEHLTGEIIPKGAKLGRPCNYTQAIADEVCERIALGETLIAICEDDWMPHLATVYRWMQREDRNDFREAYARARELQADTYFDRVQEVARTPMEGSVVTVGPDGITERREDMLGHRRLMVDALKWQAGKLRPKKYGDKLDLTTDGKAIGELGETERAAQVAGLLAEAEERRKMEKGE
ncbi:MAG: hypothetical protein ACRCYS_11435 [Beijerinckiaceae bacterium]